ncbi:MAG: hypothetical protein NVS2B11_16190 [Acetobacteraceae bacterium]
MSPQRIGAQLLRPACTQSWIEAVLRSTPVSHNPATTSNTRTTIAAINALDELGSWPPSNTCLPNATFTLV